MSDDHIIETRETPAWQLPAIVGWTIRGRRLWFGWNASSKLILTHSRRQRSSRRRSKRLQQDVSALKDRLAQDEKGHTDLQGD